jgi:DNA-binding transcriptional LysR family regulator
MDRLEALQLFVDVIDTGSFTAAGRKRRFSQPTVTRQVTALEDWLGVQLLRRSTRSITITDAGDALYRRAMEVISDINDLESAFQTAEKSLAGRLRLSAPIEFGRRRVLPHVIDFMTAHPELNIDLDLTDRHVNLVEEGFDLAIRVGNLVDQDLVTRKVDEDPRFLTASPAYVARMGAPASIADLAEHNCILYSLQREPELWQLRNVETGTVQTAHVAGRMRANNGEAMRQAVLAGHGIALLGQYAVEEDLESGHLIRLLPEFEVPSLAVQIVYPPTRHLSRRSRRFIDFFVLRLKRVQP